MKNTVKIMSIYCLILGIKIANAQSKKVLFVMSAADTLLLNEGKKQRQTGVFLNEFYMAYKHLLSAGYLIDFATPNGIKATIDGESMDDKYWKEASGLKQEAIDFWDTNRAFSNPFTLEEAINKQDQYIGLVIPGGQGLMVDLMYDPNIPILLTQFAKTEKAIGLICHAPSLVTTIKPMDNPFVGFQVNSVTPFEEFYIETFIMKGKPKNRKIAKQLKKAGLVYKKGGAGKNYAVRDKNLVTSQNPYSSNMFNKLYLNALKEFEQR